MLAFSSGRGPLPRRIALCVIIVPSREQAVEARVLLGTGASGNDDDLLDWKLVGVRGCRTGKQWQWCRLPAQRAAASSLGCSAGRSRLRAVPVHASTALLPTAYRPALSSPHPLVLASSRTTAMAPTLGEQLEGVHPMTTPDDNLHAEAVIKADPRIVALVAERYGVTDVHTQLSIDTWACHDAPGHLHARRLMQVRLACLPAWIPDVLRVGKGGGGVQ